MVDRAGLVRRKGGSPPAKAKRRAGASGGKTVMHNMACVYVLESLITGKHYTGASHNEDASTRLGAHNTGKVISTKSGKPWKLVYEEYHENYTEARKRELFLKSGAGRKWLKEHLA